VNSLADLFAQEAESIKFFSVRPERLKFFNNPTIAGEKFKSNFPKGNSELIEAGNCFVLDRFTASVCHTMRSLEYALLALENALGIQPPQNVALKTWGKTLERIEINKGQKGKNGIAPLPPSPEWAKDPDFYEKCFMFLAATKAAFRDDTFHVGANYDETGANNVLSVSAVFLNQLADKLKEIS
jgi:hypothetical protein